MDHFDTWLVDSLQVLVEQNHGVALYPTWSNASDYKTTPEAFGTVKMHSAELQAAVDAIELDHDPELSDELKYLCKSMGTKLPFLPVHGEAEYRTFARFIHDMQHPYNYDQMAIEWCKHVDGKGIWPKLPVYLRTYHRQFERNQRVRDAVRNAKSGADRLKALNQETANSINSAASVPELPGIMPQAAPSARRQEVMVHVAGTTVGGAPNTTGFKRYRGQRGPCQGTRKKPRCKYCFDVRGVTDNEARACPGAPPRGVCPHLLPAA